MTKKFRAKFRGRLGPESGDAKSLTILKMTDTLNIKMQLGVNPTIKPFSSPSRVDKRTRAVLKHRDQIILQVTLKILNNYKPAYSQIKSMAMVLDRKKREDKKKIFPCTESATFTKEFSFPYSQFLPNSVGEGGKRGTSRRTDGRTKSVYK